MRSWQAFHTPLPPRTERCDEKKHGVKWRVVEEPEAERLPDPMQYAELGELDWLCRDLAGGDIALHDRLYCRTDLVRVYELLAARKAEQITARVAAHLELLRTLE